MRINKYLSECGLCSRREADRLVADGRVSDPLEVVHVAEDVLQFPPLALYVTTSPTMVRLDR